VTDDEAIRRLREECPLRLCGEAHAGGAYCHYAKGRKVLCYRRATERSEDLPLTEAQAHFLGGEKEET
jgi:hypothetical protein